jgi:hypothetical protein
LDAGWVAALVLLELASLDSDFAVTPFLSWYLPFSGRST